MKPAAGSCAGSTWKEYLRFEPLVFLFFVSSVPNAGLLGARLQRCVLPYVTCAFGTKPKLQTGEKNFRLEKKKRKVSSMKIAIYGGLYILL